MDNSELQFGKFLKCVLLDIINNTVLMELNDFITRKKFIDAVLTVFPTFKIICNDLLNTPERVDKSELWFSLEYLDIRLTCKYFGRKVRLGDHSILDTLAQGGFLEIVTIEQKGEENVE